jgi:CheY-like chemotaxis protein
MARILIIDDDPAVRRTIVRMIECGGHDAFTASNGAEGFAAACTEQPDLVITDLMMPEQEGTETILQLREQTPGTPIIAISGAAASKGALGHLKFAEMLGADTVLEKPIDVDNLLRAVDNLVAIP